MIIQHRWLLDYAGMGIALSKLKDIGININYTEALGTAHVLNEGKIEQSILEQLKSSTTFMERDDFIGFVLPESNVSAIRFSTCKTDEMRITEGTIVKTRIAGKSFLENYIGKDYSDTLPTLEERHAIAIGKGIGLK